MQKHYTRDSTDSKALKADRKQVEKFVDALFRYADPGSYVSLRVFSDTEDGPPPKIEGVLAKDAFHLIERACHLIERAAAARTPHVFCPPIATFKVREKADVANLVNGLTLTVECDEHATAAQTTLTALLGLPTMVVASGGEWTNPETNLPEPKLHIHWRLKTPTRTSDEHEQLRFARERAAMLVGGDPTAKAIVHPLRWPGSWHRKKEPRLARIVELNPDAEIDLMEALRVLPWKEKETKHRSGDQQQAAPERIAAAVAVIPNPDLHWKVWKERLMAIWAATGGSEEGRALAHVYSKKSKKYDEAKTDAAWEAIARSPPNSIGAGTIFHLANEVSPGFAWEEEAVARAEEELKAQPQPDQPQPDDPWHVENVTRAASAMRATIKVFANAFVVAKRLIKSSREFVSGFVPPDYLIDGFLQRRYVYSLTGPTGSGKTGIVLRFAGHVATGLPIGDMAVERGRVLFFAGENPDDVRARWIKLCEEMKLDPDTIDVFFLPGNPPLSNDEIQKRIQNEVAAIGPISLLIVDTSAAYFQGDDENSNKQLGDHARLMRSFTQLPGGPTIIVTCHPLKNPDPNNLVPRGGGAFLAEVDGNLACINERGSSVTEIDTHGKFRGPEFSPFSFRIMSGTSERLRDSKDRLIKTVWVEPITMAQQIEIEKQGRNRDDNLLLAMADHPRLSMTEIAVQLGWTKGRVQRSMAKLKADKLVTKERGDRYILTQKGTEAVEAIRARPF